MIVLDACALIAYLNPTDAQHDQANEVFLQNAEEPFGISPLSLGEVLVGPTRTGNLGIMASVLRRLRIDTIALPPDAPMRLASIRAATALKMPDCCALLAAEQSNASLVTFDERLAKAASERGCAVWVGTDPRLPIRGSAHAPADQK